MITERRPDVSPFSAIEFIANWLSGAGARYYSTALDLREPRLKSDRLASPTAAQRAERCNCRPRLVRIRRCEAVSGG
jgi:hypothetical protein